MLRSARGTKAGFHKPLWDPSANLRFNRQRIKHRSEHILRSTRNILLPPTPADFAAVAQYILITTTFLLKKFRVIPRNKVEILCHSQLAIASGKRIYVINNSPYQDILSNCREAGRCGRKYPARTSKDGDTSVSYPLAVKPQVCTLDPKGVG